MPIMPLNWCLTAGLPIGIPRGTQQEFDDAASLVSMIFGALTVLLMPAQAISIYFGWPARRWIGQIPPTALPGVWRSCTVGSVCAAPPALIIANHRLARHCHHFGGGAHRFCGEAGGREMAVLRSARQVAAFDLCRSSAPSQDRRGQCRDRPQIARWRSGRVVRGGHIKRRQPRAAVPHCTDWRSSYGVEFSRRRTVSVQPPRLHVGRQGMPLGREERPSLPGTAASICGRI